jgi:hypothetical protein
MLAAGYPLENYKVNTPDGWVLNLFRIPHGKNRNNVPGKRPVIYLQHGFTLSSACFTLLNENESMAYILADAGAAVLTVASCSWFSCRINHRFLPLHATAGLAQV